MTIFQYPYEAYFNIVASNLTELGSYIIPQDGDLALGHLRVIHKNSDPFSYQMRLLVTQKEKGATLVASNWETFSNEVANQTSEFWMGDLTFTFPDYAFKGNDGVYIRIEISGYTRINNSKYLGVWCDWWQPIGLSNTGGARIALGVKR